MSIRDFKEIIHSLDFSYNNNDLILCIKCEQADVYFKFILEETNISTCYINDSVTIDTEDILLMFEYKLISNIIDKTDIGNIKFELNNKKIILTVTNSIEIKTEFLNTVDDQMLGELEIPETNIKIDSYILKGILNYFVRPSKNLSKHFMINYLYLSAGCNKICFEMDNLKISKKINQDIKIDKFKLHIDCLYNFIKNKNYNLDIHLSQNFPIVCKAETDLGVIELYSAPICD
jgi:hypothetical protein